MSKQCLLKRFKAPASVKRKEVGTLPWLLKLKINWFGY
jgi:hypothetical protein